MWPNTSFRGLRVILAEYNCWEARSFRTCCWFFSLHYLFLSERTVLIGFAAKSSILTCALKFWLIFTSVRDFQNLFPIFLVRRCKCKELEDDLGSHITQWIQTRPVCNGRIWAWTGWNFPKNSNGACQQGTVEPPSTAPASGSPPASVAEFTVGEEGFQYYDVNVVDGLLIYLS